MGLIRKTVTPAVLTVNRANSRKSTGPRSELGKRSASRNANKHLIFAKVSPSIMKELGEDPADFEGLRQGLRQALQPQDGLEEMLVSEMAENRWRWQRLLRAEAGLAASKRRQLRLDRKWKAHSHRREMLNAWTEAARAIRGYDNAPDAIRKYETILDILRTVRDSHLLEGFEKSHLENLKLLYGVEASGLGNDLLSTYEACIVDLDKRDPLGRAVREEAILTALEEEIKHYEEELALYRAREVEVPSEMEEAQLLLSQEDLGRLIQYESHLERQFQQKLQQLVAWRRARGQLTLPKCVEFEEGLKER